MKVLRNPGATSQRAMLLDKEDVTHLLVLRFQQMISEKVISPGTRLPPEREFAAYFKVARSSLRQALKVLEMIGVITQKVGDGSYLNRDASAVLAIPMKFLFLLDDTSAEELIELRLMIEPALAAKAAERATMYEIAELRQSISDMEGSQRDPVRLVAADLLFHKIVFSASGNRLSGRFFQTIHQAMLKMISVTSRRVGVQHTVAFHRSILKAIEDRDPALASKRMVAHLKDASDLLLRNRAHQQSRLPRLPLAHQLAPRKRLPRPRANTKGGTPRR